MSGLHLNLVQRNHSIDHLPIILMNSYPLQKHVSLSLEIQVDDTITNLNTCLMWHYLLVCSFDNIVLMMQLLVHRYGTLGEEWCKRMYLWIRPLVKSHVVENSIQLAILLLDGLVLLGMCMV